ncbi:hypothetical protein [Candidatus Odyssella thessalonicensis]|uniref:hypothetical protein n=1 Tax=Candidatus Odyssella thessalonicensis TaxID=84647 RepID=UPI000225B249|nr:hypothetical protein [Candidatus Odyssella thessalonicensis]
MLNIRPFIIGSLILATPAFASIIHVTNENQKPIKIKVTADEDSDAVIKMKVSENRDSTFRVDREHMNGKLSFSIKGDTNPFTAGGTCDNLKIDKDYRVTFTNDKMGTSCKSEIINLK